MPVAAQPRSGIIFPTLEDRPLEEAVQYGDPTIGWAGDENLWLGTDDSCCGGKGCHNCRVLVLGLAPSEEHGGCIRTFVMVTVHPLRDPGWRYTLLRKLRDGDWRRPQNRVDFDKLVEKEMADREYQIRQQEQEVSERLATAIQRDLGPSVTGLSRRVFPVTGKVG